MLVGSTVRRVAIVGGSRIPFARAHGAYASVGNQDMLTAALRGVVDRYQLAGKRLGDVIAGAVIKHSKDFNLVRECVLSSGLDPQTPGLDIQRACGTSLEAAILDRQQDRAGADRRRHRRRRRHHQRSAGGLFRPTIATCCWRATAAAASGSALKPWLRPASAALQAGDAGRGRAAHGPVDGPEPRADGEDLADHARRRRTSWLRRAIARRRRPGRPASTTIWSCPISGLERDNNVRADTSVEKLAKLRTGVRYQRRRHADRGQQHAADRWRGRGAAGQRGLGAGAMACRCKALLTYGKTWAVDFASGNEGLLMAPAYAVSGNAAGCGPHAAGLRFLRDPRSLRRAGAVHAQGLGIGRVLPRAAAAATRRWAASTAASST